MAHRLTDSSAMDTSNVTVERKKRKEKKRREEINFQSESLCRRKVDTVNTVSFGRGAFDLANVCDVTRRVPSWDPSGTS